ncbi:MAG: MBOAT family protein [Candidatus Aminicenantes bacterium]|nr:MBOAT family protein [Candidatus Aminicenantes bacterium]
MPIHSLPILACCAILLLVYYAVPRREQNLLLLGSSYGFCLLFSWPVALLLLAMSLANFALGIRVGGQRGVRGWLRLGILFNLLTWLGFKFAHLFVLRPGGAGSHLGAALWEGGAASLIPIGLSFYVLQAISYLVDVRRGQTPPCRDFPSFALYLAYFPKFTAGPIERPRTFLAQLMQARRPDWGRLGRGAALVLSGLLRKIVIGDTLLQAVPAVFFHRPQKFGGLELLLWLTVFVFGLYNDFCGYTDIARGLSALFGIELSPNFKGPFFAHNFFELWNRWHITLSHWLRDYVYYPIGRALARRFPRPGHAANILLPPMLTMLASGLWHGAAAGFLLWGIVMGAFLVGERLLALHRPRRPARGTPSWRSAFKSVAVFILWSAALVLVLVDLAAVPVFFRRVFARLGTTLPDTRVFLLIPLSLWLDARQERRSGEPFFVSGPLLARALCLAAALLAIFLFAQSRPVIPFVYQDF